MSPTRVLLVVHDGAINPKMGSGQRTAIVFEALKSLGPVDVAILGAEQATGGAVFFPGASSVHRVPSKRFPATPKRGMDWLRYNLGRFLVVSRLYKPEPKVAAGLNALLTEAHRLVVCRYAMVYCVTGLTATNERRICVDIDDRDDQKFDSAARAVLGQGALGRLFSGIVAPAVRRQLQNRLRAVSLLWYAAAEDDLKIPGPDVALLRNVPFNLDLPDGATSASHSRELLFVGTFAHRPNQDGMRWFLRHCWPGIAARVPDARLRIVGLGPWDRLAAEFPRLERVDYVGTVENIGQEYLRSRLVISPISEGGGSKIKVIEACAYGRPVVVADHSARGFGSEIKGLLPRADAPEDFISACVRLLEDDSAVDRLGKRLQDVQRVHFSQKAVRDQIVADIRSVFTETI